MGPRNASMEPALKFMNTGFAYTRFLWILQLSFEHPLLQTLAARPLPSTEKSCDDEPANHTWVETETSTRSNVSSGFNQVSSYEQVFLARQSLIGTMGTLSQPIPTFVERMVRAEASCRGTATHDPKSLEPARAPSCVLTWRSVPHVAGAARAT